MKHILLRSALVMGAVTVLGGTAFQLASSNATSGGTTAIASGGASATVGVDGTVAVTGVTLPGQSITLPANCEAAADQTAKACDLPL